MLFGSVVLFIIVVYIVCFFRIAATSNKDKWITMVSSRLVSAAEYRFKDLSEDITSRCTTLNYLNETTIRMPACFHWIHSRSH